MPLLSPSQIHKVLREEGLAGATKAAVGSLQDLLEKNSLTPDEVLENLSSQMRSAENPATRLRAAEIALKLNGLLNSDENRPDFHITINIIDSDFSGVNPILLPRQEPANAF